MQGILHCRSLAPCRNKNKNRSEFTAHRPIYGGATTGSRFVNKYPQSAKRHQHRQSTNHQHGQSFQYLKTWFKISNTMSRLRQRSRLRELTRRRQQTSNNNNGEHTLLDRNIFTPTNVVTEPPSTSVIGAQPTEAARNSPNQSSCGGDPTTQLPMRKPTEERNYSSTITIPKRRYTVQSSQRQQTWGDLITI